MHEYVIKRILQMIPLVFGVTLITFGIMHLAPGSPLDVMMDPMITTPEMIAAAEERLGLNQPLIIQYFRWVQQLFQGNFGFSYLTGRSVLDLISDRLGATLVLAVTAIILSFMVAIPAGIISALRRYSWMDRLVTMMSFGGISVPQFFLCLVLVYVISLRLELLPTSGYGQLGSSLTGLALVMDRIPYLIMPALAMAIPSMAGIARYTRSSMLDVMAEDYMRTARAKGLSQRVIIYKHALRNSLIPVITLFGLTLPMLFGGAFVVEYIFDWPGMGTLAVRSVRNREYSIIMAVNLVTAFMVLFGNLIADIMYAWVDPRIRLK